MNISLTDIVTYGISAIIILVLAALVGMLKIYMIVKKFRDDIITDVSKEMKNIVLPQIANLKEEVDSLKLKADKHISCDLCETRTNYRKEEIKNINTKIDKNIADIAQLQGMLQNLA